MKVTLPSSPEGLLHSVLRVPSPTRPRRATNVWDFGTGVQATVSTVQDTTHTDISVDCLWEWFLIVLSGRLGSHCSGSDVGR